MWEYEELHVLLATKFGSLYRIVIPIPIREGSPLWQPNANRRWYREHVIQAPVDEALVQVQGTHCVVIVLPGGSLLRLEVEAMGGDTTDGEHTLYRHSAYMSNRFPSLRPIIHQTYGAKPGLTHGRSSTRSPPYFTLVLPAARISSQLQAIRSRRISATCGLYLETAISVCGPLAVGVLPNTSCPPQHQGAAAFRRALRLVP